MPTYVAAGFFKIHYGYYVVTLIATATMYVAITFGLFHSVGAVAGEQAKFWLPIIAVVCVVAYICVRWFNHVNKHEGPMTPMSKEFDHPVPEIEECIEEDEHAEASRPKESADV